MHVKKDQIVWWAMDWMLIGYVRISSIVCMLRDDESTCTSRFDYVHILMGFIIAIIYYRYARWRRSPPLMHSTKYHELQTETLDRLKKKRNSYTTFEDKLAKPIFSALFWIKCIFTCNVWIYTSIELYAPYIGPLNHCHLWCVTHWNVIELTILTEWMLFLFISVPFLQI